jgi:hypothetical protein
MKGLSIGVVRDQQEFEDQIKVDGLQEKEQQFWVEVSGRAEEFASWAKTEVEFEQHYVDATGDRDSPFDRPHFTFGAVLDTSTPVALFATVMEYLTNDRNETVGAKVAIGMLATDRATNVKGRVNLTFQGYCQAPSGFADDIGVD